jgi:hypothetical protein
MHREQKLCAAAAKRSAALYLSLLRIQIYMLVAENVKNQEKQYKIIFYM